jgi:ADP-heptose:LPS heptosyltransferase
LNSSSAYNLTGQIPLTSLVKYLEDAELLISNETSPVHIAAAVNTPVICISNGNHLGRFNPYPREIFQDAHYIYPGAVESIINAGHLDKNSFRFKSKLDINEITPDSVKTLINKILNANA